MIVSIETEISGFYLTVYMQCLSLTPNASIIVSPVSDQQTNRLLSSRIFLLIYINLSVPMSFIPNMTMCSNYSPSYRQNH